MKRLVTRVIFTATLTLLILFSSLQLETLTASALQSSPNSTPAQYFVISGYPLSTTAGQSFGSVKVTVYYSNGLVDTDYSGKVYFTSTDLKATVPYTSVSKYKFTGASGDKGVHTFQALILSRLASQTITVTDGSIHVTTNAVAVKPTGAKTNSDLTENRNNHRRHKSSIHHHSHRLLLQHVGCLCYVQLEHYRQFTAYWSNNVYTSARSGTWTVTGSYAGLYDSASLTVNHAALSLFSVNPKTANISAGSTETYTASASDSYGNNWDVTSSTVWNVTSGAGGSWNGNIYTSTKAGIWTVTGTYSGFSKHPASLNVNHGTPVGLIIT